jgi:hypothetical protein
MSTVFAGGSRKVTRLNSDLRARLDQIIAKRLVVFVGDANGADKAIQKYLADGAYANVVVFCTAGDCRNNLGGWPVRSVKPPHSVRDFAFFTAKDAAMAAEAEFGLMLWDGKSSGTVVNIARMVAAGKPVVTYISPAKVFLTLKSRKDLEALLLRSPGDVAAKVRRYIAEHAREFEQPSIFGAA